MNARVRKHKEKNKIKKIGYGLFEFILNLLVQSN